MGECALDRRQFLRLAGIVAAGAGLSACSPAYRMLSGLPGAMPGWPPSSPGDFRLLNRTTYGPRAEDRILLADIGAEAWLEGQLSPEQLDDSRIPWRLRSLDSLRASADTLALWDREDVIDQLQAGTLLRQIYSRRQLYERMVEFWTDHFNISVHKGECWFLKPVDDREVIRVHAMGSFRDLLWASAHSPAMLVYLDNQANISEAPNENYARELMELHTLGVESGYSQRDVMELARCLSGWSVKEHFWQGQFVFRPENHDAGVKQVLGLWIEPAGQTEAERVIEELALHPSTARRISSKLVRRFVTEEWSPATESLVERAAQAFLATSGSIRAVLETILREGLLGNSALWSPKFKRPLDFLASSIRALNVDTDAGAAIRQYLTRMGQAAFEWPTPDGPTEASSFWETNLLPRWSYALALALDQLEGTRITFGDLLQLAEGESAATEDGPSVGAGGDSVVQRLAHLLLGAPLERAQHDALLEQLKAAGAKDDWLLQRVVAAGLIASPAFQWR